MEEVDRAGGGRRWVWNPAAQRVPVQLRLFCATLDKSLSFISLSFRFLIHRMRITATNSFWGRVEGDLR